MATQGFEFDSDLNGGNATPVIRDFILGAAAEHLVGDLMKVQTDGFIDAVAGSIDEVTCVMQENVATGDISAGVTQAKAAIITSSQVWRCSTDASTAATALVGTVKIWDTVDKNTIDADDVTNGSMIVAKGLPAQMLSDM
ncbi:MAG: hypothetical protein JRE23_16475 [Deltaproteobacteria bacterium]|nr:hypothetical protein [Deltaproteobacteria bacterium]